MKIVPRSRMRRVTRYGSSGRKAVNVVLFGIKPKRGVPVQNIELEVLADPGHGMLVYRDGACAYVVAISREDGWAGVDQYDLTEKPSGISGGRSVYSAIEPVRSFVATGEPYGRGFTMRGFSSRGHAIGRWLVGKVGPCPKRRRR